MLLLLLLPRLLGALGLLLLRLRLLLLLRLLFLPALLLLVTLLVMLRVDNGDRAEEKNDTGQAGHSEGFHGVTPISAL